MKFLRILALSILSLNLAYVAYAEETTAPAAPAVEPKKPLYERLGGEPAITAVVDDFVLRAASNKALNFTREGHPNSWKATPDNVGKLKKHLIQFVSMATGGPGTYEGKDMKTAHQNMKISEEEFNLIAADLKASLDHLNVPSDLQDELFAIVVTTKGAIVEVQGSHPKAANPVQDTVSAVAETSSSFAQSTVEVAQNPVEAVVSATQAVAGTTAETTVQAVSAVAETPAKAVEAVS